MKLSRKQIAIAALVFAAAASRQAVAQSERATPDKTLSPYFFIEKGDPALDQLPLKQTHVEVAISGVIADVVVKQVYENRGQRPIHARYVFPASTRAAVYGMTMTVGDVRIVAKIKEHQKAKAEFENAKREGKSASLLEQSRPNVFTMNVANVLPGDSISVELKYTELLTPAAGVYEFVYPTVVGPRYSERPEGQVSPMERFVKAPYLHQGEPPTGELRLTGTVSAGMPIHELSSPSHQVVSRTTADGRAEIALADSERFSGNRDFMLRYRLSGQKIASGLLLHRGDGENFFLLMAQPPQKPAEQDLPPREYVFVVDVSGSMNGFPLDTAKKLMGDLVNGLRPSDTFNILVFADGSETFSKESVPATRANLDRGLRFIGRKNGGGGTRLLAALENACAIPRQTSVSRSVVLLTDGYIDAEAEVFDYVRKQLHQANFFAFGIGTGVNRYLIEGIAHAGLGEPFIVTGAAEAEEAAGRFRHYIDSPVLTGIAVKFAGFDAYDVEPKNIPDLFASRPIVLFGKWRGDPAGSIEITGRTGRERYRTVIPVAGLNPGDGHAALQHLWARTRIANLSDFGARTPDEETIAEITSLGLKYGLLTRYTSFVAVYEAVRHTGEAEEVDQPLPLPAGVSDLAVGVTRGPEPELIWLLAIALTLLGCRSLMRSRRRSRGVVS
jgi:Ca-activated chloride channel family protein